MFIVIFGEILLVKYLATLLNIELILYKIVTDAQNLRHLCINSLDFHRCLKPVTCKTKKTRNIRIWLLKVSPLVCIGRLGAGQSLSTYKVI